MEIVQFIPGVVVSPNAITLPNGAPDIDEVVEVVIARMQSALGAHAAGAAPVAHANSGVAFNHFNAAVAQHAAHAHDLVTQGVAPGNVGVPIGWDNVVPTVLNDQGAAAPHLFTADNVTGCKEANIEAHATTQPDPHPAAAIVAALTAHAAGFAGAIEAHVSADIEVGMNPTRLTPRTFSLDVDTEVADIVILTYHEAGDRVLVA